ncbi:MAG: sigma 54-interacting transcriptional regulator [Thermoanaerobaculia bacterium]
MAHCALSPASGDPLAGARLTDRQRIGVLFQAACADAHLEASGRAILDWAPARVNSKGLLSGLVAAARPGDWLPQTSLIELAGILFRTDGPPAGRSQGRRVARALLESWRQAITPASAAGLASDLLDEADFLWRPEFSEVLGALGAWVTVDGRTEPRILGPEHFSRAVASGAESLEEVQRRLRGPDARVHWMGTGTNSSPRALMKSGQWRRAARAWRYRVPESSADRVDWARCLYSVGRFEEAIGALKGLRRPSARVLRLWCLFRLNKLGPAARELRRMNRSRLSPRQKSQLTAVAVRVFENRGDREEADRWLEEGLRESEGAGRRRLELLAAMHAWDRVEPDRMRRHLARAREPGIGADFDEGGVDFAWRWHKAAGQECVARGDAAGAVEHFSEALRGSRRRMTPFEAGALWNELAMGRAAQGDLAGTERALLHVVRLHREVQGSRQTTLTLFNLAETRIRRGRLAGVRRAIEQATVEDRRSRNWRALAHDLETWARYELARGRPHAALLTVRGALDELDRRGVAWRGPQLHLFAARALGWLGRPDAARSEIEAANKAAETELEAEEVPALWALAGDRETALARVSDGPLARLWTLVLTGRESAPADWTALEKIEPFRAARFVFDCELLAPGTAPPLVLRSAVVALREAGAGPLAERLDDRDSGTWRALNRYLESTRSSADAVTRLFGEAGYPEARLVIQRSPDNEILCPGRGGVAELRRPVDGGELVLEAPFVDEVQRVLMNVVSESIAPRKSGRREPAARPGSSIVGRSPALLEVLDRVRRLAPVEMPILILGETGTGKELLAKEVHRLGSRPDGPFLPVNCAAAMSRELLMSHLFGHVRGSFTGALQDKPGAFETASRGMVFLDEIGDLPLEAQGLLLRVLQEGEVQRIGENTPRRTEARVVSATNRDLESMVAEGTFRGDLYFRLKTGRLVLPPLRSRGKDIALLTTHFLARIEPERRLTMTSEVLERLASHDWPGNVRELESVLQVAAALCDGDAIRLEHLELPYASEAPRIGYSQMVEDYRRELLTEALRAAGGNRAAAARRLGMTRQNMSEQVKKLGLDV